MNQRFLMFFLSILFVGMVACNSSVSSEEETESTEEESSETTTEEETVESEFQILDPVSWEVSFNDMGENAYEIVCEASIDEGWYVYSNTVDAGGPIPTSIIMDSNSAIVAVSEMVESSDHVKDGYDEMFDMNIKKFSHHVTFSQVVEVSEPTTISGYLEYMTCDSIQCLFPDPAEFNFSLGQ